MALARKNGKEKPVIQKVGVSLLLIVSLCLAQRGVEGDGVLNLGPFDAGMVTARDPYRLGQNELLDAKNADFSVLGEVRCRWGHGSLGDTTAGDIIIGAIGRADGSASEELHNDLLYITTTGLGVSDSTRFYSTRNPAPTAHTVALGQFLDVPSYVQWKNGFLFTVPSASASPADSQNCIRYSDASQPKPRSTKIGLPTQPAPTLDTSSLYNSGEILFGGTYLYAVTSRREWVTNGVTYYEEGNGTITSITTTDWSGDGVPQAGIGVTATLALDTSWHDVYDSYADKHFYVIYRSKLNGSVLYKVDTMLSIEGKIDTLYDDSIDVYGPIYSEVRDNYCIDSLIDGHIIKGIAIHNNRLFVLGQSDMDYQNNPAQLKMWWTVPFVFQTPMMFNSTRRSVVVGGQGIYKTGMTSCGGRLYTYGSDGLFVVPEPASTVYREVRIFDEPIPGQNCVECVDDNLVVMSNKGAVFSTAFGRPIMNVGLVDSSLMRFSTTWDKTSGDIYYKTLSFGAIKPYGQLMLFADNDSIETMAGYVRANGSVAWSEWDFSARSIGTDPISNVVVWADTAKDTLEYWPRRIRSQKDYSRRTLDSTTIDWEISTGWLDMGSSDAVKRLRKVVINMSLTDTMNVYSYWDGSATATDTGSVSSQDTTLATHAGDTYTWYAKNKNVGRHLKLRFEHPTCGENKLRFRDVKVYFHLNQR